MLRLVLLVKSMNYHKLLMVLYTINKLVRKHFNDYLYKLAISDFLGHFNDKGSGWCVSKLHSVIMET